MRPILGWLLVGTALLTGWRAGGWPGVLLAATVTVFWLLLQFSRAMREMKRAGRAPLGRVPSAVMLNARLQRGMTMLQVIGLTRSLGSRVAATTSPSGSGDVWRWQDDGGSHVTLTFGSGRLLAWQLWRPPEAAAGRQPAVPPTGDPRP